MAKEGRRTPVRRTTLAPPIRAERPRQRARPHDIDEMLRRIRQAVQSFKKAAMFELFEDGFTSLFEQLIACIISIRTRDETTIPAARKLFAVARAPATIAALPINRIDELISASTFHEPKARTIQEIASRTVNEYHGQLPCDPEVLMSFRGVGPKCANLALGITCAQQHISVDIHVHRVTNRWGYISASTPEKSMLELQKELPRKHWIEINALLVPFGKHICTGSLPRCSTCPVFEYCRRVGVTSHR